MTTKKDIKFSRNLLVYYDSGIGKDMKLLKSRDTYSNIFLKLFWKVFQFIANFVCTQKEQKTKALYILKFTESDL